MSCQQLIQEDPYIFTDTVSNSTSFMHENNSQTKYVPLNRQTIYNRQFRQHEPKIASPPDSNNLNLKSTRYSDHHHHKIVINPTTATLKERKNNEHINGKILSLRTSPNLSRTSPKFFKSHQPIVSSSHHHHHHGDDIKSNNSKCNSFIINHSNSSVSKQNHEKQQENFQYKNVLVNHHSTTDAFDNGITGIKREKEEDDYMLNVRAECVKIETDNFDIKSEEENFCDDDIKIDKRFKRVKRSNGRKRSKKLSYSSRKSVIIEPISDVIPRYAPIVQLKLNVIDKMLLQQYRCCNSDENSKLGRDERLSMRKMQLRHVLNQYKGINQFREIRTERYKSQICKSFKFCKTMEREKQKILKKPLKLCNAKECKKEAIYLSEYCTRHILSAEKEQFLIRQCCFRHSDGQQCRIPVNNILATMAVCVDHQNAPAHHLVSSDSTEPKKNTVQRKRTKTSPLIRPVKKNGKGGRKKKMSLIAQSNIIMPVHRPTMIIHPNDLQKQPIKNNENSSTIALLPLKQENLHQNDSNQFIHLNSGNLLASSQSSYGSMSSGNEDLYIKQDLMPAVCENSYESSEDTGVGGLSENELITNDVIGNFDMESCAELTKVLSSLPSNTLDDLLTEPLHTSREDESYLDRAIEEVSASGMDQIAITAFDHLDGLDMLELDDDEQRQMISAATNLISMSGFLSSHDQDNNYSMPSPMMS